MATEEAVVEERQGMNPAVIAALVVGGLLLLALFFWFVARPFLFPQAAEEPRVPAPKRQAVNPSPSPAAAVEQPPAETFEVFESKDPFRPLVVVPVAGGAGGGTTTGGTTTGGTTTGGTTTGGTTTGGTTPAAGEGAAGGAAPTGGQRVSLIDVFTDDGTQKAQIKVGSTVYTVTVGETFAQNYKLVSVSGDCATLLHGDDKFTLCEGEEVIK